MTSFHRSPRPLKGAVVGIGPLDQLTSVIVLQYNPGTMTHKLDACAMSGEGGGKAKVYRLTGPAKETITLVVDIDTAKQEPLGEQFIERTKL